MKLLSFGEVLWDIIEDKEYLGGAPFNLAAHASKMGMGSYMISSVGKDQRGDKVLEAARKHEVDLAYTGVHPDKPTGTVDVFLKDGQPSYTINENVAWDEIILDDVQIENIAGVQWDVFCFGTLAQRTESNCRLLDRLVSTINAKHILYDINLRQDYYNIDIIKNSLEHSTILKLNDEEAWKIAKLLFNKEEKDLKIISQMLAEKCNLKIVCITRADEGAVVFSDNEYKEIPGIDVKIADAVGAGDAFSAGFLFAYFSHNTPFESAEFANEIGTFVACNTGAIPDYSEEIRNKLKKIIN